MRTLLCVSSILAVFLLFACGSNTPPARPPANPVKKQIFLVVDVSSSITDASKKKAAENASRVFRTLTDKSELFIYSTECNPSAPPIFKIRKEVPLNSKDESAYLKNFEAASPKVYDLVLKACQKGSDQSCILSGLKSVRNGLNGVDKADNIWLMVISDMLECSPIGCNDFKEMTKNLPSKGDLEAFKLADDIPFNHLFIATINKDSPAKSAALIGSPDYRAFWKKAFSLLGYSEDKPVRESDLIDGFLTNIK